MYSAVKKCYVYDAKKYLNLFIVYYKLYSVCQSLRTARNLYMSF